MNFKEIDLNEKGIFNHLIYCYLTSALSIGDYKELNMVKGSWINGVKHEELITDVFDLLLMFFCENINPYGLIYFLSSGVVYQLDRKIKNSNDLVIDIDNLSDEYKIVDVFCSPTSLIKGHKHENFQYDDSLQLITEISDNSIIIKIDKFDYRYFLVNAYTEIEINAFAMLKNDDNSADGNWRNAVKLFRKQEYVSSIEACNRAYARAIRDFLRYAKTIDIFKNDNNFIKKMDNIGSRKLDYLVKIYREVIKKTEGVKLLKKIEDLIREMNALRNKDTHPEGDKFENLTEDKVKEYIVATLLLIKYFSMKIPFATTENIQKNKKDLFNQDRVEKEGYFGIAFYMINKQIEVR
ncbi:hypothetical protein [uncultured Veillonella sp.]|uniref:hypothetical protein n=1 Tax=uncultured Veillonella sp. TaxID=159268 RepID=UPI0025DB465D|nr:hypothetical protein [uncultured Veillonella sp.]MDY3974241.1 hypothetical protein [Veillonella caviae]